MLRVTEAGGAKTPRGLRLAQRMDRLGLSASDLEELTGVDRESIARAREGRSQAKTYGRLEAALERVETGIGPDEPDAMIATVDLADGTRITFKGVTPEEAARAAAEFLRARP